MSIEPQPETIVRSYLKDRFRGYADDLHSDADLSSIVDSLGQFELIEFVEREFAFHIPGGEFRPERFATIGSIMRTIQEFRRPPNGTTAV